MPGKSKYICDLDGSVWSAARTSARKRFEPSARSHCLHERCPIPARNIILCICKVRGAVLPTLDAALDGQVAPGRRALERLELGDQ
eukprot:6077067-Pyramimonas_sp.AAC.1